MILTITKIINKIEVVKFITKQYHNYSLKERLAMISKLPYISHQYDSEDIIKQSLNGYAEYTYELTEDELRYKEERDRYNKLQIEYLEAKKWYNTLSTDDKKRVDVLSRSYGAPTADNFGPVGTAMAQPYSENIQNLIVNLRPHWKVLSPTDSEFNKFSDDGRDYSKPMFIRNDGEARIYFNDKHISNDCRFAIVWDNYSDGDCIGDFEQAVCYADGYLQEADPKGKT